MKFKSVYGYVAYYMNLHQTKIIDMLRYTYGKSTIVYAIRCRTTGMMYIGSTFTPALRFHQHLVTGYSSNKALQHQINQYSLSQFTVYILEVVKFPPTMAPSERGAYLRQREQYFINKYPRSQLFNTINSSNV